MTDITAKPFDWNDNLSEEALEDFEGIQKDLPYCTCQNIGMALSKLELLEKQGCKVIEPSGSSSEKQKPKSEWEHDHEILKAYSDGANAVLDNIRAEIDTARFVDKDTKHCRNANATGLEVALDIIDKYIEEGKA
jgi:hypothetical protein